MAKEWFASWFNSPYYNLLYQHRDFAEAETFILNLIAHLSPSRNCTFMDLACGRGRHAYFLNKQGYRVTGLDLSEERIAEARRFANDSLNFQVHDMREPFPGKWNFILNLFTSFGYFDEIEENLVVLENVCRALHPKGMMVLDFLNVPVVLAGLVPAEIKEIGQVRIKIHRRIQNGMIIKDIRVNDQDKVYDFQERVQAIGHDQFVELFRRANLEVQELWGDYQGNSWRAESSPRIIFFCRTRK
ncbi:MAG: class I SAM-dependent methyltransferase [Bacteroidota bacterium]